VLPEGCEVDVVPYLLIPPVLLLDVLFLVGSIDVVLQLLVNFAGIPNFVDRTVTL
jgi:hypothetical protein